MEGTATVSGQSNSSSFSSDEAKWEVELQGSANSQSNGWSIKTPTDDPTSVTDVDGNFKPEVSKVLNNFIGNMTIEMVKTQSPAQKISMGDDE